MNNSRNRKLAYGVGIGDADYQTSISVMNGGRKKILWNCKIYQSWRNMLMRCYSPEYQARYPNYIGCTVTPEWRFFSAFRAWMVNHDWEGKHLDKDILIPGNKVYSPDSCVFVSGALNNFVLDRGAFCGEWPTGVCWDKGSGKLIARCNNPFTLSRECLGFFQDSDAAHEAWRARKHELACIYADMQTDPRIAKALRTRYAKEFAQ